MPIEGVQFKRDLIVGAQARGFASIKAAKPRELTDEAKKLKNWLNQGSHGQMEYMTKYFDKRINPKILFPGTKSVVVFSHNYFNEANESPLKVARYAYGKDYHKVLKKKLKHLMQEMSEIYGQFAYKICVDSTPILERDWAKISGTGWTGKNTLTITPGVGSYFFLAIILLDIEIPYDAPIKDHCGTCRKCIDACPTEAISQEGYVLDGSKCISYFTIEKKGEFEKETPRWKDWIFGCDICQEVCPWNRFAKVNTEPKFQYHKSWDQWGVKEWNDMDETSFESQFNGTPVRRTKYEGLKRNIDWVSSGD